MTYRSNKNRTDKKPLIFKNMQEQLRWELASSSLRLFEGKLVGRVHVELEMDVLTSLLKRVVEQKSGTCWLQEREQRMNELCGLKAQLARPQFTTASEALRGPKHTTTPNSEELEKICEDLKAQLVQAEQDSAEEIEGLRSQVKIQTEMQLDTQTRLEHQMSCCTGLHAQIDQLEALNGGLERGLQQERASSEAQLEEKKVEIDPAKASLKKAEDQFNTNFLNRQEESLSQMKKREEMRQALKNKEQANETNQSQWEEERASLLQSVEALKTALALKVHDWDNKEKALINKLEDLEAQVEIKKKKKNKWFRRLFSRLRF